MDKKVNIKFLIIVASLVMLFFIGTTSWAEGNYSAGMTLTSKSQLVKGKAVTVNVIINNIDAGDGIDALTAKLNFDSDIFEVKSVTSPTNWNITYAPSTNRITGLKNNKTKYNETVITIDFKVKNANTTSSTISLDDIYVSGGLVANGGTGDIAVRSTSVTIKRPVYSASMSLKSNSQLRIGEYVYIKANINNIIAGDGINALTAKINYDSNVFEVMSVNSTSGWTVSYAPSTNKMTALKNTKVANNDTVFNVVLRVKSLVDTTTITLQDISVSGGTIATGGTGDIAVRNTAVTLQKATVATTDNTNITVDDQNNSIITSENNEETESTENITNESEINNELNINVNNTSNNNNVEETNIPEATKAVAAVSSVSMLSTVGYLLTRKLGLISLI